MSGSSRGGRIVARSPKSALGAAFIARGLAGSASRDPATGRKKSPGLFGSVFLVLFGGVFLGVGVYLHSHSAALRAQPGTKGSPEVAGWICIVVGGLVVVLAGFTLISRILSLLIGLALLVAGVFGRPTSIPLAPAAPPVGGVVPAPAPLVGPTGGGDSGPLLPPPLDPRLPDPSA
jgi:hypothetical protein